MPSQKLPLAKKEAINQNLQQALPKPTPHNRAPRPDSLVRSDSFKPWLERGVNLDKVHCDKAPGLVNALSDVVAFAQGEAAAHGGAGARCPLRIEGVDVEGEMDGGV